MDYITKTDAFKAILDALAEERSVYDAIAALPNADVAPVRHAIWRYKTMTVPGGRGQTYAKWSCTAWWQPGLVVLRVRITGLKYEMYHWKELDEILVCGDINPERILQENEQLPRRFVQNWKKNHLREATKMIKDGDGDV